jgi:hypothetical protein
MEAKEILQKVKEVFNSFVDPVEPAMPEAPAAGPTKAKLADGTEVEISNMQPGGTVTLITPQGPIPAPAGEHQLEDGTVLVVAEGGIISEVKPVNGEAEVSVEVEVPEDMGKKMKDLEEKMAKKLEEIDSKMAAMQAKTGQSFGQIVELFEKFAAMPTASPDPSVTTKTGVEVETKHDKFARIGRNIFNKK